MKAQSIYYGPWQQLVAVKHVLCSDGHRRYARITSEPDTFFTVPASVSVQGKTVSGFISSFTNEDGEDDYSFSAVWTGKNAELLIPVNEMAAYQAWKARQHAETSTD